MAPNLSRYGLFVILLFIGLFARSQSAASWQQKVDFIIDVSLNDQDHTLDGFVKINYSNQSPDTLHFIWMHCWPNAFKTDRTAFSDQLLENGRTDFYFSDKGQRGYINHLDIRVDGQAARMEDHPQNIDIIRIWLPKPLLPGGAIQITTPFHEQLPFNFSRGGHVGKSYQITQWYPKPALYDSKGWHEMPYLDQGEFFNDFGNYDVRITVPENYAVAAPGTLQPGSGSILSIRSSTSPSSQPVGKPSSQTSHKPSSSSSRKQSSSSNHKQSAYSTQKKSSSSHNQVVRKPITLQDVPPAYVAAPTKTLHYIQDNATDFAWFADAHFQVDHDTILLPSGKSIDLYAYYQPASASVWRSATGYIKDAILFRSRLIGDYPYNTASVVEAKTGTPGGMEYPAITSISPTGSGRELDLLIEHEIGHNWFQASLATDERTYPWMDEGINTFYDHRYSAEKYPDPDPSASRFPANRFPKDPTLLYLNILTKTRKDQPINTPSQDFSAGNYDLIPYDRAAYWLEQVGDSVGLPTLDSAMRAYYRRWQFHHPYPQDFRSVVENTAGRNLSTLFDQLDHTGYASPQAQSKKIRPAFLFNSSHSDSVSYIDFAPGLAFNKYDGLMLGVVIHNYNLLPENFRFAVAPLYATGSRQFNAVGRASYTWYKDSSALKWEAGLSGERLSSSSAADSNGRKLYGGYYKVAPFIKVTFPQRNLRSTVEKWVEWRTFLIGENQPGNYVFKTADSTYYPSVVGKYDFRYLNQLSAQISDSRVLYPWSANLQLQQADRFYRVNFTGKYFFNYPAGGGMQIRLFAAKFGYLGGQSSNVDLSRFQPKLTGVSGSEDYTYSNYFIGRSEYAGFSSHQIMDRDGGLKIRVPSFPWLEGRSDNWVSAINFNTTLPRSIAPAWLPLTVFFDIGTYSGAWSSSSLTSHFLYTGGLELAILQDVIHIYAPIVYSSDFGTQLKTLPDQNGFWKRLSFSIELQNIDFKKIFGNTSR